jgi:hypothetical protein
LAAEQIGDTELGDLLPALVGCGEIELRIAEADGEAIACMNATAQFACVAGDMKNAEVR